MSITPTTPRDPLPPPTAPAHEAPGLYDASTWETAYRHFDEDAVPQLLLHLQDDLTRARRREAAWLSVIVHLLVIILFVNQPKIEGFYRRVFLHQQQVMTVSVPDLVQKRELTVLELPPDEQRAVKRPNTDIRSDKDRIATTRTPQIDPKELRKLMASAHPGLPGSNTPAPQPGENAAPPMPQANQDTQAQHPGEQAQAPPNQLPQLQSPATSVPSPQIKFGGTMSAGSAIEQAARAAAENRGGGYGDGGDYGLSQGKSGGTMGQVDILSDTMGFDFNPYLQRIFHTVDRNWRILMPESVYPPILKKGMVFIEFSIMKDGSVQGLKVVGPPADVALVRAAWGSITNSTPFPPLPGDFPGQYLELRFKYFYNLNLDGSEVH
jgi:hypothetical protein